MTRGEQIQMVKNTALNKIVSLYSGKFRTDTYDERSFSEQRDDEVDSIVHELKGFLKLIREQKNK